jgi:superfamily II DNA or RNA helicase
MKPFYYSRQNARGNTTSTQKSAPGISPNFPIPTSKYARNQSYCPPKNPPKNPPPKIPEPKPEPLTEEFKQTICENSYLGNKGYTIPKIHLSTAEIQTLITETTITPKVMGPSFGPPGSANKDSAPCLYYKKDEINFYLPRAYGIARYGLPYETRLSFGRDVREALAFASDKPLRDYQTEIINVYLEHIRKQYLDFEVFEEGAVDFISGKSETPISPDLLKPNQTHLLPPKSESPKMERVEYGGGGILEVPCGRGKTVMALKIISEIGRPAMIYVNKGFLADQWLERIATYLPKASVGRIQADTFDVEGRDIVICMIQTVYDRDYTHYPAFRQFGITIIDECHRIGSGQFSKAMFNITTPYVLGISATVDRKDGMEKALNLFMGDVLYSDKRQDGDCVQIRSVEYSDPTNAEYNKVEEDFRGNVKYSTMMSKICEYRPRLDFLFRILTDLVEEYPEDISGEFGCAPQNPTSPQNPIEEKGGETAECPVCRNHVATEEFIQTSCSHSFCEKCLDDLESPKCPLCKKRFSISYSISEPESTGLPGINAKPLTEYPGQNQIIVLAQYRSVLKELYKRIQTSGLTTVGYYVGGMKQEELDISKTKQILLATYSMASEGLDVATLSTLVFATPRTDIKQSVGRILRQKHARNPIVVDVVDSHSTFKNQWSKRRAYYKQNSYVIYRNSCDQYTGMKNVEKTWKCIFSPKIPTAPSTGEKSGLKKGEDSDEDDSEAIRKMAFDGVCML